MDCIVCGTKPMFIKVDWRWEDQRKFEKEPILNKRRMLASNRSLVSSGTLRLIALSLVFNGVLAAIVIGVTRADLPIGVLLLPFVVLSVLEMVALRAFLPHHGAEEPMSAYRSEIVRRVDPRRRNTIVDESTGLYTRWYFDRRIEEEAARCKRYKHSMAVIVLRVGVVDLTTFSTDGWQQRSLEAAQRAAKIVREVDISAAISPFEFAICLIHCDRDGAYRALDRMLLQLPDYKCEVGVAVFPDEGYEAPALIDLAAARMRDLQSKASA